MFGGLACSGGRLPLPGQIPPFDAISFPLNALWAD
ncbi:hypothetical protein THITH_13885 [Thioalkalivibrio paradoxus ARh 1]|uniref:Uncharacterized protein n=1 Tax=Thioalkalivibrio paradoxus ARh 1 TaxID=713585 RepID=W0DSM3_9GAMM|nr:hypothetical protein THITH_13885 [Thioalkalivibrio paradoxus ARh 1]